MDLESFRVGLTPTVFYIPGFITDQEEAQLLNHVISSSPHLLHFRHVDFGVPLLPILLSCLKIYGASGSKWKTLKNRRLQNWGVLLEEFSYTSFSLHCVLKEKKIKVLSFLFILQVVWSMKRVLFHKSVSNN